MGDINALLASASDLLSGAAGQPWVYAVVAAGCLIDGIFPPFPSETMVAGLASLAASQGGAGWFPLLLAAALGAFAGDNAAYAIGRGMRARRFHAVAGPRMQRSLARAGLELERRAVSMILAARFVPVGRVAVNLSAGAAGYPRKRFVPITAFASLMWAAYMVGVGVFAGTWFRDNPLLGAATAVVTVLVVGLAVDRLARPARKSTGEDERPVLEAADRAG